MSYLNVCGIENVVEISFWSFTKGFLLVFSIALLSYFLAAQGSMKRLGIGYAAWALILGLLISNTIKTPAWAKNSLQTEFYIKTGLVLVYMVRTFPARSVVVFTWLLSPLL